MDTISTAVNTTANSVASDPSFGALAGIALILLAGFVGVALLLYGWPEIRRRK